MVMSHATEYEICRWLVFRLSELLSVPAHEIRVDCSLFDLGLDSAAAVGLTDELSEWLNRAVDPTLLYDHPTISQVAHQLAQPVAKFA